MRSWLIAAALAGCGGEDGSPGEEEETADSADSGPGTDGDFDGDGYLPPEDCDDTNAAVSPASPELCDGADNDCDGTSDEGLEHLAWYADADGDGYGPAETALVSCAPVAGYVTSAGDCDDADPWANPGAAERCESGQDDDCDGLLDCEDGECAIFDFCREAACADGVDDEADGLLDCEDPDCMVTADCGATMRVLGGRMAVRYRTRGYNERFYSRWTWTYGTVETDMELHFSGHRTQSVDAYSVSGVLRLNSGATACYWQVGHAWAAETYGLAYTHFDTNWRYNSGFRPFQREGFQIDPACPVQTSGFLPDTAWIDYNGPFGASVEGGWWYQGALSRSDSTSWRTTSVAYGARSTTERTSGSHTSTWEVDSLTGGETLAPLP